jgi:hypothetical protein
LITEVMVLLLNFAIVSATSLHAEQVIRKSKTRKTW